MEKLTNQNINVKNAYMMMMMKILFILKLMINDLKLLIVKIQINMIY